ncbi:hypothetical protein [Kitasatospora sp. MAP5-34]|uniref:hypothetical protein n=1 Tax=Kitasatospora sp. MAP5-34 TaxID=3035102 RepID=UPI002476F8CE|nr:hypothetical protein [Kitasatospora sp. MAP5-34]MDH6578600.1 hypothetical protein [Kitasatospora sp. MAP5-34]
MARATTPKPPSSARRACDRARARAGHRDGRRIGEFSAPAGGTARAHWDAGSGVLAVEAAPAYVLAAAFGVGAPGLVKSAIGAGVVSPPF